jgi:hypothetical protein
MSLSRFARTFAVLGACLLARAVAQQDTAAANSATAPSEQMCRTRANDTVEKLLSCIQAPSLWQQLSHFQEIADAHPDAHGHGNRDTGTSGYKASVDYVVGLMQSAGYQVTIQSYPYAAKDAVAVRFGTEEKDYAVGRDYHVPSHSGSGILTAVVQPVGGRGNGCVADDFFGFARGNIALLPRGGCAADVQVEHAQEAGAAAVILYNNLGIGSAPANESDATNARARSRAAGGAYPVRLKHAATIPVVGVVSSPVGWELLQRCASSREQPVHLEIGKRTTIGTDYNVIAESPLGDANHIVVVDAHLDSIFGAGMLDNASGSTTMLEIALNMANTATRNRLRYIWFGGEELGLLGSAYYTTHLTDADRQRIEFDIDVDVTATPNFDYLVADPKYASNVNRFPKNVVPQSQFGNAVFETFFKSQNVPARSALFGNDGTDSNSFSLIGIPNSGILTQQDCCKADWEVKLWGGVRGNYEGKIPSFDGGCVDYPDRWCDNLSNNDPDVLELASKAAAYVTLHVANHKFASAGP